MQIIRGTRGAASCSARQQQRVPTVVHHTGWSPKYPAEQASLHVACSCVTTSSIVPPQQQYPRRAVVVAAAAEAGDAAADAEIGIHAVEELRGIRANLDSQDPVVEYRVHWKDDSPDTW